MKIVDKKACEHTFGELNQGDVFKDKSGTYCMKVEPFDDKYRAINFITLEDGVLGGWFEDNEVVIKVNCELVIKDC